MNTHNTEAMYQIEELESRLEMVTPSGDCTCHCTCAAAEVPADEVAAE